MKIKNGYTLKKVMGSYMIIGDISVNKMQTVNETGAFLWNLLSSDTTIEKMCEKMICDYDIEQSVAERDIKAFVEKLKASDLLDE